MTTYTILDTNQPDDDNTVKNCLKNRSVYFYLNQFYPLLINLGQVLILVPKTRGFPTSFCQNAYANDITHKKILVCKQGVVSQLPDFKSYSERAVSG